MAPPTDTNDLSIHDEQDNWDALPGNPFPEAEETAAKKFTPEARQFIGLLNRNADAAIDAMNLGSASFSSNTYIQNGPTQNTYSFVGNPAQMNGPVPPPNQPTHGINAGNMLTAQPSFITNVANTGGYTGYTGSGGTPLLGAVDSNNPISMAQHHISAATVINVNDHHSYVSPYKGVTSGDTPQFNIAHPLVGAASGPESNAHGNTPYRPVGGPQVNAAHPLLGVASGSGSNSHINASRHPVGFNNAAHPLLGIASGSVTNAQVVRDKNCPEAGFILARPPTYQDYM